MFDRAYIDWNFKRVKKIIDYFGAESFFDKTVLDLGCGHSDIGGALARLGARVIAVDARKEHLAMAKKKYPHITTMCVDLDKAWPFGDQKFDYVLNLGLLCHLTNYKQILQRSCMVANKLILELEVCDSNDVNKIIQVNEYHSVYDWAFNGVGNKPSAPHIEQLIQEAGMKFRRLDTADLNSGPFKYDWKVTDSHTRKIGHRRLWICSKTQQAKPTNNTEAPKSIIHPKLITPVINSDELTIRPEIVSSAIAPNAKNLNFKVAVCISGYLRSFDQTFDRLFNNLLKQTNADVFIHTWDYVGAPLRGFDAPLTKITTQSILKKINQLYKPQKIVIEPPKNFNITSMMVQNNFEHRDINGVLSMFYKIKACNDIKSEYERMHNFKYDCVVRLRSDLMFMSPFYLSNQTDLNKLYIPNGYDYEGLNDQIAYGGSEIMDKYSEVFDNIEKMLYQGEKFNPERLLKRHILNNHLPLVRSNMHYYIKRAI